MGWNDEKQSGDFLKIEEGKEATFKILNINQKAGTAKIKNLSGKAYYYEFETDKGNLIVNNMGLFWSLQNAGADKGDTVRAKYVKKGVPGTASTWDVEVIGSDKKITPDTPPDFEGV